MNPGELPSCLSPQFVQCSNRSNRQLTDNSSVAVEELAPLFILREVFIILQRVSEGKSLAGG